MSYELTMEQFENINLFSNRNMEKVMTGVVNSSSNAALVNMGEDSVILLDHKNGDFYIADYEFDREKLTVEFSNYERIDLIDESNDFENDVRKVFESEDGELDFSYLSESYKRNVAERDSFLNELVSYTMSRKSFDNTIDYDNLSEAMSDLDFSSTSKQFFKEYTDRLEDYPLTEVKRFDWINPVKVSLIETEREKLVNRSAIAKAHDLWKRDTFKNSFAEASEVFVEDVEEGTEKFKELMEEFPQVFFLDTADRRALFGKAILGTSDSLRESMDDLLEGIDLLFEKYELADMRESYLAEMEDEYGGEEDMEIDMDDEYGDDEEMGSEYEPAEEVENEDLTELISDLRQVMSSTTDQKTVGKLEFLITKLQRGMEEGTRPDIVKEAVAILSL